MHLPNASFDYRPVVDALINVAKDLGIVMIEDDSEGDLPPYPFATYTFTSPFIPIGNQLEITALFEAVISITFHDRSKLNVLNLSRKLATYFKTSSARENLRSKGIIVVSIEAVSTRDNFISIGYERMAGFDMRIRLFDMFQDNPDTIEKINFEIKTKTQTGGN